MLVKLPERISRQMRAELMAFMMGSAIEGKIRAYSYLYA